MARFLIYLLRFLTLWLCLVVSPAAQAKDLSGTVWIFSVGNPPQPFPENTWKIVTGVPGSQLSVDVQRGTEPSAQMQGTYDGAKIEVQGDWQESHGVYRGRLTEDGTSIEGSYSEARPTGELIQPFRLTRLDSLSRADTIQISWAQQLEDPEAVVCKASLRSGQSFNFKWSLDGLMQPAMTQEVRFNGVTPGSHRILVIGFQTQPPLLTAPQTLTFETRAPRSWNLPLLMVALVLLALAGLRWGRKEGITAQVVDVVPHWDKKLRSGASTGKAPATDESVLQLKGNGRDEVLVQIRGDAELRAPDPSPRLLLKKVEAGVMLRSVYLGARPAKARLEVHWRQDISPLQVAVEPIFMEVQVEFAKQGFATRRYATRVSGLCGAIVGRIASAGRPVAFASCKATLRLDGGGWSTPVSVRSDAQGDFRFDMPPLMIEVLGTELAEFRLEKVDLPSQSSEPLETLCAADPQTIGGTKAMNLHAQAEAWLKSLAEWVAQP